ncbi:MAG TPA: acyl carrier protein [Haliangium sp.]|nr:acyl carrier protein [Haliangium sp.]
MTSVDAMPAIKTFLDREVLKGEGSIEPTTPLLEWGLLDSLNILQLVAFLSEEFAVDVPGEAVIGDNFQNLESIGRLVSDLLEASPASGRPAHPRADRAPDSVPESSRKQTR